MVLAEIIAAVAKQVRNIPLIAYELQGGRMLITLMVLVTGGLLVFALLGPRGNRRRATASSSDGGFAYVDAGGDCSPSDAGCDGGGGDGGGGD
jgi:hypothetical protein